MSLVSLARNQARNFLYSNRTYRIAIGNSVNLPFTLAELQSTEFGALSELATVSVIGGKWEFGATHDTSLGPYSATYCALVAIDGSDLAILLTDDFVQTIAQNSSLTTKFTITVTTNNV